MMELAKFLVARPSEMHKIAARTGSLNALLPMVMDLPLDRFERRAESEDAGYILCGPRFGLREGRYFVFFWIEVAEEVGSPRLVFDAVAWEDDKATTVGEITVVLRPGRPRVAVFPLRFELLKKSQVEIRVWSDKNVRTLTVVGVFPHRFDEGRLAQELNLTIAPLNRRKRFRFKFGQSFEPLIKERTDTAPWELWLAFHPAEVGDSAYIQFKTGSGPFSVIEVVEAQTASQLALSDGRAFLYLPFHRECVPFVDGGVAVTLGRARVDIMNFSEIQYRQSAAARQPAQKLRLWATGNCDVDASGRAVRLKLWAVGERLNPPPLSPRANLGEEKSSITELRQGAVVEFDDTKSAFFLFETGPDCGVARLEWGTVQCQINLFERSVGAMIVFIPDDFSDQSGNQLCTIAARQRARGPMGTVDMLEVIALGRKHPASHGSEVFVDCLWRDYPLSRTSYESALLVGSFVMREGRIVLWRGSCRIFGAQQMSAVQLLRHPYGGLCAVCYQGHLVTVDLYAPNEERILVFPAADEPIVYEGGYCKLRIGEIVHPALRHVFRRMRPSWLPSHD